MSSLRELQTHWRTALGCLLGASIGVVGLYAYTSGVFAAVLIEQAGYSMAQLSWAPLALSLSVAVAAPFAGALMDRFGAIRVIAVSLVGEAAGFALLGLLPAKAAVYVAGVMLLALLGVGTTPLGYSRIVTSRFVAARGMALGLAISGLGVVAMVAPLAANALIGAVGWRASYLVLAAVVLAVGGLGLLLISKDRVREPTQAAVANSAASWAGLRTPLFWGLTAVFLLPGIFGAGYVLHLVSLLRARGYSPTSAAGIQSLVGLAVLVGRLGSGAALDKVFAPYVAAATFAITGLGCLLLLRAEPAFVALGAFGLGVTVGAELDILAYTLSRYFGVASFGRLYGVAYGLLIVATGVSPLLIAALAKTGGYPLALTVSAAGLMLASVLLLFAPRSAAYRGPQGPATRPGPAT